MPATYLAAGARISGCGTYRYKLWREWRGDRDGAGEELGEPKSCLFVMLNPSTAAGEQDDPTIRRCIGFAKAWRFEYLEVVNLFAYRATKPRDLLAEQKRGGDPIGWENSTIIADAAERAGLIVCAWGAFARELDPTLDHAETVRGWLGARPQFALGFTKHGDPRHPLYAPQSSALVPMPR